MKFSLEEIEDLESCLLWITEDPFYGGNKAGGLILEMLPPLISVVLDLILDIVEVLLTPLGANALCSGDGSSPQICICHEYEYLIFCEVR